MCPNTHSPKTCIRAWVGHSLCRRGDAGTRGSGRSGRGQLGQRPNPGAGRREAAAWALHRAGPTLPELVPTQLAGGPSCPTSGGSDVQQARPLPSTVPGVSAGGTGRGLGTTPEGRTPDPGARSGRGRVCLSPRCTQTRVPHGSPRLCRGTGVGRLRGQPTLLGPAQPGRPPALPPLSRSVSPGAGGGRGHNLQS